MTHERRFDASRVEKGRSSGMGRGAQQGAPSKEPHGSDSHRSPNHRRPQDPVAQVERRGARGPRLLSLKCETTDLGCSSTAARGCTTWRSYSITWRSHQTRSRKPSRCPRFFDTTDLAPHPSSKSHSTSSFGPNRSARAHETTDLSPELEARCRST